MKNTALINSIKNSLNGENYKLRKPVNIRFNGNDVDVMESIVKDNGEWCLQSKTWLLPLTELTNRELIQVKKSM